MSAQFFLSIYYENPEYNMAAIESNEETELLDQYFEVNYGTDIWKEFYQIQMHSYISNKIPFLLYIYSSRRCPDSWTRLDWWDHTG